MKKIVSLLLASMMAAALAACGGGSNEPAENVVAELTAAEGVAETEEGPEEEEEESSAENPNFVTVSTYDGEGNPVDVEVPYNPERLAVMDLAALDILDNLGVAGRATGVAKGSSIDYLQAYMDDDSLLNLGTIKEADLEAVMESEPDVIFIGGRLSSYYDALSAIAPVILLRTDSEIGVVESTANNARGIASIFGLEEEIDTLLADYDGRIATLLAYADGKTAVIGMVNAGGFGVLGNDGRCSIIGVEIGFKNIGVDAEVDTSTHGNDASFEFLVEVDPEYIFIMDRDAAIGTEGAELAAEVMDNELVNMTKAAQDGNVIILEHSNVWYTAEGGITALGIMLADLESALL